VSLIHDRDRFSDETPIADAVEQEQETTPEPAGPDQEIPPVETDASDWQDQHQEVAIDDWEEYRD
jgi:hypothetical protein